ncbi:unnamed protein product, partial [Meganyctiphanes norvegica]
TCALIDHACGDDSYNKGVCRVGSACNPGETEYQAKFCSGDSCRCCGPPVTCLLIGNTCGENKDGVCRVGTCNPGEIETHDTIFCSGDSCSCCVSKVPTTPPAPTNTSTPPGTCALIGKSCGEHSDGLCRYGLCNYDETECYDNSCSGANCRCCVPP